MRLRFSIAPVIAILLLYQGVLACQCTDPFRTPYEEFDDSAVVFLGVVSGYRDNVIDAPNQMVERTFQFKAEETLKGDSLKNRNIVAGITRDICYVGFGAVGSRYLVYAYERRGRLVSNLFCSRASISDLYFLRMRLLKVKEPRIYGLINREKLGKSSPWPVRIQIVAEDKGTKILTKADKSGRFAVNELPDGVYLVKIETPVGQQSSADEEYRIRLGDAYKFDDLAVPKRSVFLSFPVR